jgi:hypothetical protein
MNDELISVLAFTMAVTAAGTGTHEMTGSEAAPSAILIAQTDDLTPMTTSERLGAYVRETFGPKSVATTVAHVEVDELRGGSRATGFASRLGAGLAQHAIRGTLLHGTAALLHEDNRYRRAGEHGFWRRTKHVLTSSLLARHDNGRRRLSVSRLTSAGGAAFLARAWAPRAVAGASTFGVTIAADVGANMFREFWPDLKRALGRK